MISPSCNWYNDNNTLLNSKIMRSSILYVQFWFLMHECFIIMISRLKRWVYWIDLNKIKILFKLLWHSIIFLMNLKRCSVSTCLLKLILTSSECHIYLKWCWRWWSSWNYINQLSINCPRYTLSTGGSSRVANKLKTSWRKLRRSKNVNIL